MLPPSADRYLTCSSAGRQPDPTMQEWTKVQRAPAAPGLKRIEDALDIRRRLLLAFEAAESSQDEAERRAWLTFIIIGGGPTGVELVA